MVFFIVVSMVVSSSLQKLSASTITDGDCLFRRRAGAARRRIKKA
jgi:hypothetical protein